MKINVKWGKEQLKDVEIDLEQPPIVFKTQLMSLTGVPVDRQKISIKALKGFLKDDDWLGVKLADGQQVMMIGTAETIPEAPKEPLKFVEDLPQAEQDHMDMRKYGVGMKNLGNTCYMNSTIQCFYAIPELRDALQQFGRQYNPGANSAQKRLTQVAGQLFEEMGKAHEPYMPMTFWMLLKQTFPQFSQQGPQGMFMQQDAEECWSQLMYVLKEHVKVPVEQKDGENQPMEVEDGQNSEPPPPPQPPQMESLVKKLFGIDINTVLKSDDSSEVITEKRSEVMLKCNIQVDVNYLHQAIELGLEVERKQVSQELGQDTIFKGKGRITNLPPYLTLHLLRFDYRSDTKKKAKILRKVQFPMTLDMHDYCDDGLKEGLKGAREAFKNWEDLKVDIQKGGKGGILNQNKTDGDQAGVDPMEQMMKYANCETGKFELFGVLTHKGRYGDSGHYVAWIKNFDGVWVMYDDENLIIKTEEDVKELCGGGEWHTAYLLLYRVIRIPSQDVMKKEIEKAQQLDQPTPTNDTAEKSADVEMKE